MGYYTYYKKNKETILNRAKEFYENNKEKLRKKTRNKYKELSKEEKDIKREYGRNRYHSTSKEKNKMLKEYQKYYREANKSKESWFFRKQCINFMDLTICAIFSVIYY